MLLYSDHDDTQILPILVLSLFIAFQQQRTQIEHLCETKIAKTAIQWYRKYYWLF